MRKLWPSRRSSKHPRILLIVWVVILLLGVSIPIVYAAPTSNPQPEPECDDRCQEISIRQLKLPASVSATGRMHWAGYIVTSHEFTQAIGHWVQPNPGGDDGHLVGSWVGLGGVGSDPLYQAGTYVMNRICGNALPVIPRWCSDVKVGWFIEEVINGSPCPSKRDFLPNSGRCGRRTDLSDPPPIAFGQCAAATVTLLRDQAIYKLTNCTTGVTRSFSQQLLRSSTTSPTAEWITEDADYNSIMPVPPNPWHCARYAAVIWQQTQARIAGSNISSSSHFRTYKTVMGEPYDVAMMPTDLSQSGTFENQALPNHKNN